MKKVIAVAVAVVAVFSNLRAQEETQKKVGIENIVPQKTLLLYKVNDVGKYMEKSKETIMYRIFDYLLSPEFAEILKSTGANPKDSFQEAEKKFQEETGMTIKELAELPAGEVALAITSFKLGDGFIPKPKVELVFHCGLSDTEKAKTLLEKIGKKAPELQFYNLGKGKVLFSEKDDVSVYFTVTDDLGIVLTVGDKDYFENIVAMLRGEKDGGKSLADSPVYKKVMQPLDSSKADYISYINLKSILTQKDISDAITKANPNVEDVLDCLGITSVKAVGAAERMDEKGRSKDSIYIYAPGEKVGLIKALANATTNRKEGVMLTNEGDYGFFMGGTGGAAIIASIAIPSLLGARKSANETAAQKQMVNVAQIESLWYKQDCDRNGQHDYWTYDYSGFYYAQNAGSQSIQLLDIASGNSDKSVIKHWATLSTAANGGAALAKAVPRNGYYVAAIKLDPSGEPYCQTEVGDTDLGSDTIKAGETKTCNATEFGFCAYPAEYGVTGVSTFICDQTGVVYQKDTGEGKPIKQWPVGPGISPTTAGWALATD